MVNSGPVSHICSGPRLSLLASLASAMGQGPVVPGGQVALASIKSSFSGAGFWERVAVC
jgi:hypothetical protein